jgi:mycofactocin biosynthetic radical S-adenosylmethionine protein MftC
MAGLSVNVKSHYCGTGTRGTYFISNTGNVYPCPNMRFNQFKLGSIREKSLKHIIIDNPIIEELKLLNVDTMNKQCQACDIKYFCGGFCRGETFSNKGDLYSPYVRCKDYREGILEAMWTLSENPQIVTQKTNEFLENAKKLSN